VRFFTTPASALVDTALGDLGLSVIAITTTETIPTREQSLAAGDQLFAIGHPAQLRKLEAAATGTAEYEPPIEADRPSRDLGLRRSRFGVFGGLGR